MQMDYGWTEIRVYDRSMDMLYKNMPTPEASPDIEPEDVAAEDNVTLD
jgi:hypothetical protein